MPVKSVHSLEGMVADLADEERSLSMDSLMPLSVDRILIGILGFLTDHDHVHL
jgi:hypothetical protein